VIGIDNDPNMVTEARLRTVGTGLGVAFYLCDIHRLPVPGGIFDTCRAERVFQHLQDPGKALSEMIRVAKPSARILVMEPDWETPAIDIPEKATPKGGGKGRKLDHLYSSLAVFSDAAGVYVSDF
jgi:ubiquinone/menaquinone biosynthesis C-methylase UbiE